MELARIALTLTVLLGPSPEVEIAIDVAVAIRVDVPSAALTWLPQFQHLQGQDVLFSFALPHVIVLNSRLPARYVDGMMAHELVHIRQYAALGPALPLLYVLTGGQPFEDYLGDEYMWEPPAAMLKNCPLMTFNSKRGVQLLPCWVWR